MPYEATGGGGSWGSSQVNISAPSTLDAIDSIFGTTFRTWAVGSYMEQDVSHTLIVEGSTVVDSPNADGSNYLRGVSAVSPGDVWAVGYYIPTGQPNLTRALILHRDGAQWSIVPANEGTNSSRLDAVTAVAADDVWAAGRDENDHTLMLHWNGIAWSRVPSPNVGASRNILRGVSAVASNSVWAVGYYGSAGTGRSLFLHWDGAAWNVVPSPDAGDNTFPLAVDAYSENSVWVVGNYFVNGIARTLLMRWNGSNWEILPSPNASAEANTLNAVAVTSPNEVWAVGDYASNGVTRTLTETFTQSAFSDVPPENTFYQYVQCMACQGIISGYADGTFRPGNDVTRGQLSKIVSNSAGFNDDPGPQLFEDESQGSTFYDWVNRLANRGFIGGYPCGGPGESCGSGNLPYFRPNSNATRGQISKIVSNAAGYIDTPTDQYYEDVPPSNPFYLWIERLSLRNIMSGYQCGGPGEPCGTYHLPYFRPGSNVTRGQTAKIVTNTFFPNCQTPARR